MSRPTWYSFGDVVLVLAPVQLPGLQHAQSDVTSRPTWYSLGDVVLVLAPVELRRDLPGILLVM